MFNKHTLVRSFKTPAENAGTHPIVSLKEENEALRETAALWQTLCIILCFSFLALGVVVGIYVGTEGVVSTSNYNSCIR